jgi:hypothetical protein
MTRARGVAERSSHGQQEIHAAFIQRKGFEQEQADQFKEAGRRQTTDA